LIILGLGFLRARLLQLCAPLLSLESFYNYARGHCAAARNFFRASSKRPIQLLQSYALCSSEQCSTVKLRLPMVRELFWGMLGRGDGGWRGNDVSESGYTEVLALEVRNVV